MTDVVKTAYIAVSRIRILRETVIVVIMESVVVLMGAVIIPTEVRCVVMEMEIAATALIEVK